MGVGRYLDARREYAQLARDVAGAMLDQYFNMVEQILTQPGGFVSSASMALYLGRAGPMT
jgi:hypothetical protein